MRIEARAAAAPAQLRGDGRGEGAVGAAGEAPREASLGLVDEPLDVTGGHGVEGVADLGTDGHAQPEPPSRRSVEPETCAAVWAAMPCAAAVAK